MIPRTPMAKQNIELVIHFFSMCILIIIEKYSERLKFMILSKKAFASFKYDLILAVVSSVKIMLL